LVAVEHEAWEARVSPPKIGRSDAVSAGAAVRRYAWSRDRFAQTRTDRAPGGRLSHASDDAQIGAAEWNAEREVRADPGQQQCPGVGGFAPRGRFRERRIRDGHR
jgi:hypothetical protein